MKGQNEATVDMAWEIAIASPRNKERKQEETRYKELEKRDAYRFDLAKGTPIKLIMIIDNIIILKGIILNLSAGGFACDFFEPINLPIGKQTHVRFRLEMDDPAIIKTDAVYLGVGDSRIPRFDFSEILSESDQDRIHQYILIKQLEIFRNNRRQLD